MYNSNMERMNKNMESLYESLKTGLEEKKSENVGIYELLEFDLEEKKQGDVEIEVIKKNDEKIQISIRVFHDIKMFFTIEKEEKRVFVGFWAIHGGKNAMPMSYLDLMVRRWMIVKYYEIIKKYIREDFKNDSKFRFLYMFEGDSLIQEGSTLHSISKNKI